MGRRALVLRDRTRAFTISRWYQTLRSRQHGVCRHGDSRHGQHLGQGQRSTGLAQSHGVPAEELAEQFPDSKLGSPILRDGPQRAIVDNTFGGEIDTLAVAQYFARLLPMLADASAAEPSGLLRSRVQTALDRSVRHMTLLQKPQGNWDNAYGALAYQLAPKIGPWYVIPSVISTTTACSALELSRAAGRTVDEGSLRRGRCFLAEQFDQNTGTMHIKSDFDPQTLEGRTHVNPWRLELVGGAMRATAALRACRRGVDPRSTADGSQVQRRRGLSGQPDEARPEG